MNNSSIYKQTIQNLGTLRLNQMKLHLEEVAGDVGTKNLSFTEGLLKLICNGHCQGETWQNHICFN